MIVMVCIGLLVGCKSTVTTPEGNPATYSKAEGLLRSTLEGSVPDVVNATNATLDDLELTGIDSTVDKLKGKITARMAVGTKLEVIDQAIYVNGVPVKFNGVNSHMQHPETGHTMDVETMRKDLCLMKQFNINCVRTCHYPPNVEYIELADELGMYIVDETGDEAHAYTFISHDPRWREQYLDRMKQLVYRDRNHPCVVIWSAGNESGPGENLCAIMEEGKKLDPSRPAWMYGGKPVCR